MAYYEKVNTDLKLKLLAECVVENHPVYKESPFREAVLQRPADFNLEHLIEQSFALCSDGLYEFNDGIHEDFTDESECKTGTLHLSANAAEITNVRSKDGVLKKGAIRAVVVNPDLEKLHYFFIPKAVVENMMTTKEGKPKVNPSLWIRYSSKKKLFTSVEKYGIIEHNNLKDVAMEKNR